MSSLLRFCAAFIADDESICSSGHFGQCGPRLKPIHGRTLQWAIDQYTRGMQGCGGLKRSFGGIPKSKVEPDLKYSDL